MKKKIAISFMIMALVMALAGGATFAYYTDWDMNSESPTTITSGTLNIDIYPNEENNDLVYQTSNINLSKMEPGQTATFKMYVKNVGNVDSKVQLDAITNGNGWTTDDMLGYKLTFDNDNTWATIAAGQTQRFNATVEFLPDSGNSYRGTTNSFYFKVFATQALNPETEIANITFDATELAP